MEISIKTTQVLKPMRFILRVMPKITLNIQCAFLGFITNSQDTYNQDIFPEAKPHEYYKNIYSNTIFKLPVNK